ncbi:cyclic nucleotide-binding domain-containing protein [Congregibacter variabilis]|uniref:Cyclic nucleotide-binding domain-containing protein n=1 Tax=Congregibacter variabilis TaxID=3081200 RepID=A0ABZ0I2Y4_9GAMM|nr:cyclic nucleotide-binding domain-containing protein [Congregibacter sp. IMCC43200]
MKSIAQELSQHPFFDGLCDDYLQCMLSCSKNTRFPSGRVIATEGSAANEFFVITKGRVALQLHSSPAATLLIQTLDAGDILGWSWLFPPYRWSVEAMAVQDVQVIAVDGSCLRDKCDADPVMGYQLMQRFSRLMSQRIEATRLQLLDLYGQGRNP